MRHKNSRRQRTGYNMNDSEHPRMILRPRFATSPTIRGHLRVPDCPPLDDTADAHVALEDIVAKDQDNAEHRLKTIIALLDTAQGERLVRAAHRETLIYKQEHYTKLLEEAERDVTKERDLISLKMPDLKRTSRVEGDQDNWLIFESVSRKYIEAKDTAAIFDSIRVKAQAKLESLDDMTEQNALSGILADALKQLLNFRSQSHIVGTVVDIIGSFLKNPNLVRNKFLNFMMVGAAGTGKTTLAGIIAKCLASAGMFVDDRVVTAGRAEFVAEYEGQTVARTRHFLTSNLDAGVIFVDEAYGITQWNDGKPESYGTEAVTAMVEFMSKYKGLYCIITAGYEKEMQRYFLSTNPGLARRFPFRFVLRDLSPYQLTYIFQRTLLTEQGLTLPPGEGESHEEDPLESKSYFQEDAWRYLTMLIAYCTSGQYETIQEEHDRATRQTYKGVHRFSPTYPHMHQLFMNQAGSMTNLAEECVTVLMSRMPFGEATRRPRVVATFPRNLPVSAMKQVIRQRIMNSALSRAPCFLRELVFIERHIYPSC
jgi:SpoVK/Ycf46/Vps4 family AAA+-type ATPase